jgi:hypothetical protein
MLGDKRADVLVLVGAGVAVACAAVVFLLAYLRDEHLAAATCVSVALAAMGLGLAYLATRPRGGPPANVRRQRRRQLRGRPAQRGFRRGQRWERVAGK